MNKLVLYKEAQPFVVNQKWGVPGSLYAQFGFSRHNGLDIAHGYNSRLRAPFPFQVYRTLWQPEGGGLVLSIVSTNKYDFDDGISCHVLIDYLHLARYIKTQGQGGTGELIAIAGNTGFSTGPHTHIQPRRVRKSGSNWVDIDRNDANNSFDPLPYYTAGFAVDYKKPEEIIVMAQEDIESIETVPEPHRSTLLSLWEQVLIALSKLLTKG